MDVTPVIPAGKQVLERYGTDGFRVSGVLYPSAILLFPDRTLAWAPRAMASVTEETLAPVLGHGEVEILLLGCGRRMALVPPALRATLKQAGIVVDAMDTGAACRTYSVLLGEGRRVAAALLPVSAE
ncbi:MAG TPA: Mth938-like domain-containing protein [Aliidongia sp.]|uniref:Mth938-like domain-containing protein n=1 Tax=Aliidongia sp. TaxID=1914230 RepID=UPI002DDD1DF7|nr:Mth938-like domain-containing protein [Aliidongia sp.]HEV2673211.1 Mth938-like domain-containing protein [Aliidongia sp.]